MAYGCGWTVFAESRLAVAGGTLMSRDRWSLSDDRFSPEGKFSSIEGHLVDALAPRGDEGRGTLRKASGSCEQALIRRCPNGETPSFGMIPH